MEKDLLFEGDYNGSKSELIDQSYILTEDLVAFLYSRESDWSKKQILLTYSVDQGETWRDTVVSEQFPSLRFRKVDFINELFGYVIISGDRTMSQEYSTVFLTHDGGETWRETDHSGVTRLISDGGFVDENTGFLSYGTLNPTEPDLWVTQDGGVSWSKSDVQIPEEYIPIFVSAEVPVMEGEELVMLVNQGPNGDYEGGRVKGQFVSNDNGLTWEFLREVMPDENK
ncbi:WD40/YVTN/BNR-like repeat-containing protein [Ornithinibacillus salinisoli]